MSEFDFDKRKKTCYRPEGNAMWLKNEIIGSDGKQQFCFESKLTDCRECPFKVLFCMRNPESADTHEGHGRQVLV